MIDSRLTRNDDTGHPQNGPGKLGLKNKPKQQNKHKENKQKSKNKTKKNAPLFHLCIRLARQEK